MTCSFVAARGESRAQYAGLRGLHNPTRMIAPRSWQTEREARASRSCILTEPAGAPQVIRARALLGETRGRLITLSISPPDQPKVIVKLFECQSCGNILYFEN